MKAIRFHTKHHKLAGLVIAAAVVVFALLVVVWTVSNTAAGNVREIEAAEMLTTLSPRDAQTHLASARLHEKTFEESDLIAALHEYELAAAMSPNDYQLWLRLGAARSRSGDAVGAEAAFRRALELAPNYSRVQWALANLLLRSGSGPEAYDLMRAAVKGEPSLAANAAATLWQFSGNDIDLVTKQFDGIPQAEVQLISILLDEKRYGEAAETWSRVAIPADDADLKAALVRTSDKAFAAKQFRLAAAMLAAAGTTPAPATDKLTNGGFETALKAEGAGPFEWRVAQGRDPSYAMSGSQPREGALSLAASFRQSASAGELGLAQFVPVTPGRAYTLSIDYRSEVNTKAELRWEVVSALDGKRLGVSEPLKGSANWATASFAFTVPQDVDGVEIRFIRDKCPDSRCPASGNISFDNLTLSLR